MASLLSWFRSNWGVHLVSLWQYYHRDPGGQVSNPSGLCDGLGEVHQPRHLHVQHAVRLLHSLQVQTSVHRHHEQNWYCQQQVRSGMDAGTICPSSLVCNYETFKYVGVFLFWSKLNFLTLVTTIKMMERKRFFITLMNTFEFYFFLGPNSGTGGFFRRGKNFYFKLGHIFFS